MTGSGSDDLRDELFSLPLRERSAWIANLANRDPAMAEALAQETEIDRVLSEQLGEREQDRSRFAATNWTGQSIGGRYQLCHQIGEGASSKVFLARQNNVAGRDVVVKLLDPAHAGKIERELEALVRLPRHAGFVYVIDAGVEDSIGYLVLQHLEGETLAARIGRGPLPWAQAIQLSIQLAGALGLMHECGIIHRDVKPENILLIDNGQQGVLIDFGIAHLATGSVSHSLAAGTPRYLAVEQVRRSEVSARTDIYALGIVLLDMLRGNQHESLEPPEIRATIRRLRLPGAVANVLVAATALEPDQRPRRARDLVEQLQSATHPNRRAWLTSGAAVGGAAVLGALAWQRTESFQLEAVPSAGAQGSFVLRIRQNEPRHFYLLSEIENGGLSILWPAPLQSSQLGKGMSIVPEWDWNSIRSTPGNAPEILWVYWSPYAVGVLEMASSEAGRVHPAVTPEVWACLHAAARGEQAMRVGDGKAVQLRWPGTGSLRLAIARS